MSRPSVDAPRAAPPGLRVCRPSLPRPARRRPCGSRGCRGGPGLDPAQVAPPQARGAATPCPAEPWAPPGTAAGRHSRLLLLLLLDKEVRASGSGRSRRSFPSPRGDERRGDRGGRGELGAGGGGRVCSVGCAVGASARRPSAACVGAPAALREPGVQPGTRMEAPACPGQPLPRGDCRPPWPLGSGGFGLFKGLSGGGFGCAGWRRAARDGRGALGPRRSLVGSRCGCGPGWGPRDLGAPGGLSHRPVGRNNKGGWLPAPGEGGCGGRALWSWGPGKPGGAPHP